MSLVPKQCDDHVKNILRLYKMKQLIKSILPIFDILLIPVVFISSITLKLVRRLGIKHFYFSKKIFTSVGIFPIREHYYEPLFNPKHLYKPLSNNRNLPGINWNVEGQLELLRSFSYRQELEAMPDKFVDNAVFNFNNDSFKTGDSEYWYSIIRTKKPRRIIEIGSGNSTKMAKAAIETNKRDDAGYTCKHICIEPYEMPWLEEIGVEVVRQRVESIDSAFFAQLEENDILFIDSSHMIRPQGDVLYEFLEIIPTLKTGVIVHIHDIFSPRDYLKEWIIDDVLFWNEQYLLEAFLSFNNDWEIIGALNYLKNNYYGILSDKCPKLSKEREPGSFYIVRK
jgi:hypothetical protein